MYLLFLQVPVMMDEALGYLEERQVLCFLFQSDVFP